MAFPGLPHTSPGSPGLQAWEGWGAWGGPGSRPGEAWPGGGRGRLGRPGEAWEPCEGESSEPSTWRGCSGIFSSFYVFGGGVVVFPRVLTCLEGV